MKYSIIIPFLILILVLFSGCSTNELKNSQNVIDEKSNNDKIVYLENTSLEQFNYCKDKGYQCYIEIGILNQEENICYIFKDSGSWNKCHYFMAYIFPKYETCDAITDFKKEKGGLFINCLKNAAENSQDPSFCDYMEMTPEQKKRYDEVNMFGKVLNSDKEACLLGIERNKKKGKYIPHFTDFQKDLIDLGDKKTRIEITGRESPVILDTYLKVVEYAKLKNDPKICEANFGSSVGWEPCEMEVITSENDISKCDYFWHENGPYTERVECWLLISKDPSVCEEITVQHRKEACYLDAFSIIEDQGSCEKISNQDDKNECLAVLKNEVTKCQTNNCFLSIALKHGNKEACQYIKDDAYEYENCIVNLGLHEQNFKVCEILNNYEQASECVEDISRDLDSSSLCYQINNKELKEVCIQNSRDNAI